MSPFFGCARVPGALCPEIETARAERMCAARCVGLRGSRVWGVCMNGFDDFCFLGWYEENGWLRRGVWGRPMLGAGRFSTLLFSLLVSSVVMEKANELRFDPLVITKSRFISYYESCFNSERGDLQIVRYRDVRGLWTSRIKGKIVL